MKWIFAWFLNTLLTNQWQGNTTLQQFIYDNLWSSLDFINYAGKYVAEGRYDLVQTLLGGWPGNTNLDQSYSTCFDWFVRMHHDAEWKPDNAEMLVLPNYLFKNGVAVYAVRNLSTAFNGLIEE